MMRLEVEGKRVKWQLFVSITDEKSFATFAGLPVSSKVNSSGLATPEDNSVATLHKSEITWCNRPEDHASNLDIKL